MKRSADILLYNQPSSASPTALAQAEYVNFTSVVFVLWRRRRMLAISVGAGLLLAAAFVLTQQKVYEARASIEIQVPNEDYLNRRELNPVSELNTIMLEPYLQTQLRLIQSDTMLLKVARQLDLAHHPEYDRPPGFFARLKHGFRTAPPQVPTDLRLLEMIRDRLTLHLAGQTQILDIFYDSTDPALAAKVSNGLAETYQTASLSATNGSASQTATLLSSQITGMKRALDDAEAKLRGFVDANRLLPTNNMTDSVAQLRLKQLQADLGVAHDARVAAQSKYEMLSAASPEALAQQLDSDTLRAYRVKLTELRQQYAENIQVFTPQHYKIRQLQAEIDAVQQAFDRERAGILGRLLNDYKSAEFRENSLARDYEAQAGLVAAQSGQSISYDTLKHDVDMKRQIYDSTLQKLKEADLAAALEASNVRIVDHAVAAEIPIKPNKILFAGLGLGAGFLFGTVLAFAQARTAPVVATRVNERVFEPSHHVPESLPADALVVEERGKPNFGLSDSAAQTSSWLINASENGAGQVVCISSVSMNAGGLEVACKLATQLAAAGRKTLLIDADGVSPTVHKEFRLSNSLGLFDLLHRRWQKDGTRPENAIWMAGRGGFFIMPAGTVEYSREALPKSARVRLLFNELRRDFDFVLVVMPPLLGSGEAQSMAALADGTLLATALGPASFEHLHAAAEQLETAGVKVVHALCSRPGEDAKDV